MINYRESTDELITSQLHSSISEKYTYVIRMRIKWGSQTPVSKCFACNSNFKLDIWIILS